MIASDQISTKHDGEIDLFALWQVAWAYKRLISFVVFLCGLLAVVYALLATPIYRAQVVVTLAEEVGMGGGAFASQLGGLASLAGVSLGGAASAEQEAQAVLKSRRVIEHFIQRNNLLPAMSEDGKDPPTLWGGVRRFQESIVNIREDARQGVTTVAIEWTDAATAARWANGFIAVANELIRTRALEESERNIAYLNGQVEQTSVVELRRVMYNLIEGETKKLMIANGRTEYAFKVVDPAVPPEMRAKPRRTVIVLVGLIIGFLVGSIIAIVHNALREPKGVSSLSS